MRLRLLGTTILLGLAAASTAQTAPVATQAPIVEARTATLFEEQVRRDPAATAATGPGVVSTADARASEAGAEMLRRGGSAADAIIAAAVALTVVEPQSSGIGGGGFALYHDAATGRLISLDGREQAPASARPDRFLGPDGKPLPIRDAIWGGRSVGVPGLVALAAELHRRHGRLPWATLFEPAIRHARDGIVVTPRLARIMAARRDMLAASAVANRFLNADGSSLKQGQRLVQPELAVTLETIAKQGPQGFYAGTVAQQVSDAVSTAPRGASPFTPADMASYRVVQRTPLCAPYRGWRVCSMAPPSAGGFSLIQMLGILEKHDLRKLGRDNPLTWHLFAEANQLALADRAAFGADPGFAPVPTDGLTDPNYIAERAALVRIDRAIPDAPAGNPPGSPPPMSQAVGAEAGTSHLSAADAQGNVVALTSTIESIFGSGQVAGGFFLNNQLTDFDLNPVRADGRPSPNRVEAGKRPRSSMTPVILYGPDGRVAGSIGAAGGSTIIAQVATAVVGVIDFGLPIEQAIAQPVLHATGNRIAYNRDPAAERMVATWKALGHEASAADLPLKLNGVMRVAGGWRGAGDPRSEGQAVATGGAR